MSNLFFRHNELLTLLAYFKKKVVRDEFYTLSKLIAKHLVKRWATEKNKLKIKCSTVSSNKFTYHIYNHKNSRNGISSEKNSQTDAEQGVGVEREERVTLNTRFCDNVSCFPFLKLYSFKLRGHHKRKINFVL